MISRNHTFLCSASAQSFQVLMDLSESLNLMVGVCFVCLHLPYPGYSEVEIFSMTLSQLLIGNSMHVHYNLVPHFIFGTPKNLLYECCAFFHSMECQCNTNTLTDVTLHQARTKLHIFTLTPIIDKTTKSYIGLIYSEVKYTYDTRILNFKTSPPL